MIMFNWGILMRPISLFLLAFGLLVSSQSYGLDASGVFKKVSKSIYVVVSKDSAGQVIAQGSGVLVGKSLVITNCHVIKEAASIVLVQQDRQTAARLKNKDAERDLCTLATEQQTTALPVVVSTSSQLEHGQAVYAVGAPLGLELTISDGIVSGLRKATGGFMIQTTAAISPGSSGGGLFDENGRLVGITTYQYVKGQNLNFAVPAEWVPQVSIRETLEVKLRARREAYERESKSLGTLSSENRDGVEKQIRLSRKHLQDDPNHIPALFTLGFALSKSGNLTDAEAVYVKLLDSPANGIDDYFLIGIGALDLSGIYDSSGREDLARMAASRSATYIPDKLALGNYWSYLKTTDHYREALPTYRLATELYPKSPEAWAYLGACYRNLDEANNAIQAFKNATQLKPDYEWAWLGYMVSLRKAGKDEEFKKVARHLYDNQRDIFNNTVKLFTKK
ncbi:MAG: tetratricopeptide repeat-containing serine protease family protein [Sulfurimicrobium sp.]|nr:tetratricopeptide repeat-containing serine protease family protein [Sulfurimicrobium sp.]MDP2200261.1 tetratricopeptide repeat-containing serine protease family protein [Sulfurimicrobium sp.]MDP3689031.1 tetratricopeptide repeat-containing serine protease family protein [Sulfurimicrobium sp.]